MKGARLKTLGIDRAERRAFPNITASQNVTLTFGDISLTSLDVSEAESDHDSVWILRTADWDTIECPDGSSRGRIQWLRKSA